MTPFACPDCRSELSLEDALQCPRCHKRYQDQDGVCSFNPNGLYHGPILSKPEMAEFFRRLASFSRLIVFDKRGTGASDRPRTLPTLEVQMDDVRAVLDEVGSDEAALFGVGAGGQMAALFAATYPERTTALVLYNTWARLPGTADEHRQMVRMTREHWGRREINEESWR